MQNVYKTIVLSDIHLGSKWSRTKEVIKFIKNNKCENLILCGDIIDGWEIMHGRKEKWKRKHTNFLKLLLKISHDTNIVYVRGNHDDFLDRITPVRFLNISIVKDYVYTSFDKKYYVLHGDVFDRIATSMKWLAKIGDIGYSFLLWLNHLYNQRRIREGLPYYSISQEIKHKVKTSVSYISDFEYQITKIAESKKCDAVICGHIHHPDIKQIGMTGYLNSGDWVESMSALTEDYNGNWSIYRHEQNNEDK